MGPSTDWLQVLTNLISIECDYYSGFPLGNYVHMISLSVSYFPHFLFGNCVHHIMLSLTYHSGVRRCGPAELQEEST